MNLQVEPAAAQLAELATDFSMIEPAPPLESFADTAGLIANLDLIITFDTAVTRLAGAVRKPVSLMVPFASD